MSLELILHKPIEWLQTLNKSLDIDRTCSW